MKTLFDVSTHNILIMMLSSDDKQTLTDCLNSYFLAKKEGSIKEQATYLMKMVDIFILIDIYHAFDTIKKIFPALQALACEIKRFLVQNSMPGEISEVYFINLKNAYELLKVNLEICSVDIKMDRILHLDFSNDKVSAISTSHLGVFRY